MFDCVPEPVPVSCISLKRIIRETNKKLYDSNDGLRSALASAAKRRVSPLFAYDEMPHVRWHYIQ